MELWVSLGDGLECGFGLDVVEVGVCVGGEGEEEDGKQDWDGGVFHVFPLVGLNSDCSGYVDEVRGVVELL